jgi:hypothetical protein
VKPVYQPSESSSLLPDIAVCHHAWNATVHLFFTCLRHNDWCITLTGAMQPYFTVCLVMPNIGHAH